MTRKERRKQQFADKTHAAPPASTATLPPPAPGDFSRPHEVNGWSATMGAGREVYDLMPKMADIPDAFKGWRGTPYNELQAEWFFKGLDARVLVTKPGIDRRKALTHLQAIQLSFEPSHEHKEAGVAYLMSLWFDIAQTASKHKGKEVKAP